MKHINCATLYEIVINIHNEIKNGYDVVYYDSEEEYLMWKSSSNNIYMIGWFADLNLSEFSDFKFVFNWGHDLPIWIKDNSKLIDKHLKLKAFW